MLLRYFQILHRVHFCGQLQADLLIALILLSATQTLQLTLPAELCSFSSCFQGNAELWFLKCKPFLNPYSIHKNIPVFNNLSGLFIWFSCSTHISSWEAFLDFGIWDLISLHFYAVNTASVWVLLGEIILLITDFFLSSTVLCGVVSISVGPLHLNCTVMCIQS